MLRSFVPVVFCLLAVFLMHHPMVLSGFDDVQVDAGDTRLLNYIMEHGFRSVSGDPNHPSVWEMDFFYPTRNVGAFTDVMLATAPPYWLLRTLGVAPDSAFQGWMLAMTALNFLCFFFFLRRCFDVGTIPASCGSLLFAAASSRMAHLGHQQLLPQVFVLLALTAIGVLWGAKRSSVAAGRTEGGTKVGRRRTRAWIALFFFACVSQVYSGFYNAFFLSVVLLIAALVSLFSRTLRERTSELIRTHGIAVLVCGVLAIAMLVPIAQHYGSAAEQAPPRPWHEVESMLPRPQSWLYPGVGNYIYRHVSDLRTFQRIPMPWEHATGFGVLTGAVCLIGLVRSRKQRAVGLILATTVIVVLVTTRWPLVGSPWRLFYDHYPAADAVRAVSRIGLWALIPASLGLALFVRSWGRHSRAWAVVLLVLCFAEQAGTTGTYDKRETRRDVARLQAAIPAECDVFYLTAFQGPRPLWRVNVDAMWAQMLSSVPTINGYSGLEPPGFGTLGRTRIADEDAEAQVERDLQAWIERHGLDPEGVCRLRWEALSSGP